MWLQKRGLSALRNQPQKTAKLPDDVKAKYAEAIPLGLFGSVQNVADAVSFLASDKAAYITGQVLSVNGGLYC